jgi:hypothetical protein
MTIFGLGLSLRELNAALLIDFGKCDRLFRSY